MTTQPAYQPLVLELFKTQQIPFRYDDKQTNFLYLNGVVGWQVVDKTNRYLKFPSPLSKSGCSTTSPMTCSGWSANCTNHLKTCLMRSPNTA